MELSNRVVILDSLRGIAALAVCWYHFVGNRLIGDGPLRASGSYGWLGVHVFFVISGFVIPLALRRENYQLNNYGTFLTKRLVRLYPPYIASLAVTLLLLIGYSLYKGVHLNVDVYSLSLHLGLLNGIAGREWLNSIYWTLAIELQFYLVLGLIFPALMIKDRTVRWLSYVVLALPLMSFGTTAFLFRFIFLFLMGIVTFQFSQRLLGRSEYVLLLVGLAVCCYFSLGVFAAIAGASTALLIQTPLPDLRLTRNLGKVSYSLYLLHGSIGSLILFGLLRYVFAANLLGKSLAVIVTTLASIGFAVIGYRLIERPAIKASAAFRYQTPRCELAEDSPAPILTAPAES